MVFNKIESKYIKTDNRTYEPYIMLYRFTVTKNKDVKVRLNINAMFATKVLRKI